MLSINNINKIIICVIVFMFYSHIFSYLAVTGHSLFVPVNFIALTIVIVSIMLMYSPKSIGFLKNPIYIWLLFYCIVLLIWLVLPNAQATEKDIRGLLLSIIFLFLMTTLMYFDDHRLSATRKAILFVTLLAIANNIYEFFNPLAFYKLDSGYNILGRSAGFYINSNKSGEAIIFGLIFSYRFVPEKLKSLFLIVTLVGILVTFSRTGIALWFIVVFILAKERMINAKSLFLLLSLLVVGIIFALPFLINYIETDFATVASNLLNRLDFFSTSIHTVDYSERERIVVAMGALEIFTEHPLLGGGISLTQHWHYHASTHNIYLKLMAELGVVGLLIYPLLIWSSVWRVRGTAKKFAKAFIVYVLAIGFTTHNILDSYHILIAFALMANLSYKSRQVRDDET